MLNYTTAKFGKKNMHKILVISSMALVGTPARETPAHSLRN